MLNLSPGRAGREAEAASDEAFGGEMGERAGVVNGRNGVGNGDQRAFREEPRQGADRRRIRRGGAQPAQRAAERPDAQAGGEARHLDPETAVPDQGRAGRSGHLR